MSSFFTRDALGSRRRHSTVPSPHTSDNALLGEYVANRSERAFGELVRRRGGLVYGAALRRCGGNRHDAEEVVQQVFAMLAAKAPLLVRHPTLSAWLYTAARNAAINLRVAEQRRHAREQAAMNDSIHGDELDWTRVRPVLDESMDQLGTVDRTAILLRYFEAYSFAQVGAALNLSENAARMRTERALDKLRAVMANRGVSSTAAALVSALAVRAVSPVPDELVQRVVATAIGTPLTVSSPLWKTTLQICGTAALGVALALYVWPRRAHETPSAPSSLGTAAPSRSAPATPSNGSFLAAGRSGTPSIAVPRSIPREGTGGSAAAGVADAREILRRMAAAYADLTAYEDFGEVDTLERSTVSGSLVKVGILFETHFLRPSRLRFDWTRHVALVRTRTSGSVVSDGKLTVSDPGVGRYNREADLAGAIRHNAAVSYSACYHVPQLLLTDPADPHTAGLATLMDPQRLDDDLAGTTECYVIRGRQPRSTEYTLWIAKHDFLLRKIVTRAGLSPDPSLRVLSANETDVEETHHPIPLSRSAASAVFQVPIGVE